MAATAATVLIAGVGTVLLGTTDRTATAHGPCASASSVLATVVPPAENLDPVEPAAGDGALAARYALPGVRLVAAQRYSSGDVDEIVVVQCLRPGTDLALLRDRTLAAGGAAVFQTISPTQVVAGLVGALPSLAVQQTPTVAVLVLGNGTPAMARWAAETETGVLT